jgi:hypothetical protein
MTGKTDGLKKARDLRSKEKREAVEKAIAELSQRNEAITFQSIAAIAGVSRQYLYNNFKDSISVERNSSRSVADVIDGIIVPTRTPDEHRHIESLLRNKIEKLEKEMSAIRQENARMKQSLEKERGRSEHFRQNWLSRKSKDPL